MGYYRNVCLSRMGAFGLGNRCQGIGRKYEGFGYKV